MEEWKEISQEIGVMKEAEDWVDEKNGIRRWREINTIRYGGKLHIVASLVAGRDKQLKQAVRRAGRLGAGAE